MGSEELKNGIVSLLLEKKALDVKVIRVSELTIVADYFIVATERGAARIRALCEFVDEKCEKEFKAIPSRIEGLKEARWIVMDYGGVIVHLFNDSTRTLYALEQLWGRSDNVTSYSEKE